jgi:two-component system sensor histidine kinase PilS (NtrC family)
MPNPTVQSSTGAEPGEAAAGFLAEETLLRWLYLARLTLVSGIFVGALIAGTRTLEVGVLLAISLAWTGVSFWRTHLHDRPAGFGFRYGQVLFDIFLVTSIVHITGGAASSFSPLYIVVISEGALLLPLPGGVLVGLAASAFFAGDAVLLQPVPAAIDAPFLLQIGLFTVVAILTGILGDRLRQAGMRLGAVQSELEQLRLDTSDILDNLSTGVLTVDGAGRLVYMNAAGAELLELIPEEWLGAPILDVIDGLAPGLGGLLAKSIQTRTDQRRFSTTTSRDGQPLTLGVSTTVLERAGEEAPSATALFQDITLLEQAARLNRRTQRLEAVAALSASLAHEIKNPLASIRSSVEQLAKPEELAGEDRAILQRLVLDESDRLSRLLSDFIEFSAIRMGRSESHDFDDLVRGAVRLAAQHPDAEGVALDVVGHEGPLPLPGDRDLLHRAVYNLVLNALQFAGREGRVRVELRDLRHLTSDALTGVRHPVMLVVQDSGPGIDESDEDLIFDPFFTRRRGGSGLGLSVVQRAVKAHHGAVLVGNHPGGGAEFTLILPGGSRSSSAADEASPSPSPSDESGGPRPRSASELPAGTEVNA